MKNLCLVCWLLMLSMGSSHAQEAKPPIYYYNPDWSPDASSIVFESTRDGKYAIYTIRVDGTGLRKLSSGEVDDEQPRWSPDGRQIVFISSRDGHLQLYLMDADGSHQRRLTQSADIDYQPDFSPKGDVVVFQSRTERASVVHDIYIVRTDGSGRTRLTDQRANYGAPRWSPDGKKILFERNPIIKRYYKEMSKAELAQVHSSQELYVMNRDGTGIRNLTNNSGSDCCATWSKDGKTIYFVSEREGAPHVYLMRADGSNVRKVADGSVVSKPTISRDRKYFAYTKEVNGKWGLYIYTIKTGRERLLIGG
jgi:TolB protein